jgi:hypothetical protein
MRRPIRRCIRLGRTCWPNCLAGCPRPASENDRVLIAFAGHAFGHDDGELYLAAQDTESRRSGRHGRGKVSWLKEQLAACPAQTKLLLLDTRDPTPKAPPSATGISAAEAAQPLNNVPGLIVLAASSAGQASLVCTDRQQSLLMFWTGEGLKGHADSDSDGQITADELATYVQRQVAAEAQQRFDAQQRPSAAGIAC